MEGMVEGRSFVVVFNNTEYTIARGNKWTTKMLDSAIRGEILLQADDVFFLTDLEDNTPVVLSTVLPNGGKFMLNKVSRASSIGDHGKSVSGGHPTAPRSRQESVEMASLRRDQIVENFDAMLSLERLNIYLSNERTGLAWMRTTCVVLGISISIAKIKFKATINETVQSGFDLVIIWGLCVALICFLSGGQRYFQVRGALGQLQPSDHLSRFGLRYSAVGVLTVLLFIFVLVWLSV